MPLRVVVLDDDPTGTQTVHGVSVLTRWTREDLVSTLAAEPLFFILTNSRGLSAQQSSRLHADLMDQLLSAAGTVRCDIEVVSRSDSTLRGHYPLETDVIRRALEDAGHIVHGEILVPFFGEGGRVTADDVHYVETDGTRVPVGETEFARDNTFGYRSSNLRDWIEEKSGGRVRAADVRSISLGLIRRGGAEAVAAELADAMPVTRYVVNAETYDDLAVFVRGLHRVRATGNRFVYRTAASFVRVFGGIEPKPLLRAEEMLAGEDNERRHGGLVVVGSHVNKSTEQLRVLLESGLAAGVEFHVGAIVDGQSETEVARCVARAEDLIRSGKTAVVYTTREVVTVCAERSEANLDLSTRISDGLAEVVRRLAVVPRFVVAKGGITSSDVATKGLGIRKATVLGQVLPGVPVWRQGTEAKFPGCCYVVFPGNVGAVNGLKAVCEQLIFRPPNSTDPL